MTARVDVDGAALEVRRWSGRGMPVLMLHEGLGSVALWKDFPARLAEATGREVIAYSRRGYGASDPMPDPFDCDYMHREATVAARLCDALSIARAHWFGHSDGASIALIAAAAFPDRVASLVLEAPHVFVEPVTLAGIRAVVDRSADDDMLRRMARYHTDPVRLFERWCAIWLDPRFAAWTIEDMLARVAAPMLLLQGRGDEFGTLEQLDRIEAAVRGSAIRRVLDDCRHSPHFDQPSLVLAATADFLAPLD